MGKKEKIALLTKILETVTAVNCYRSHQAIKRAVITLKNQRATS